MNAHRLLRLPAAALCILLVGACAADPAADNGSPSPDADSPAATGQPDEADDSIDLADVDTCSLIDVATVQQLTGESVDFTTQDSGDGIAVHGCFWGATQPGIGAYVEITLTRHAGTIDDYTFGGTGCSDSSVEGVGVPAKGGTCPGDPQTKVYLAAVDRGVLAVLLVNDPSRPLTPEDLAEAATSVVEQL